MPKRKHRKKKTLKKLKSLNHRKTESSTQKFLIRRHRFPQLRNDKDFLAMIKVGRAVNAVISSIQFISDYKDDDSPKGKRQYNRAIFTTCGYLYEGLLLIDSLRLRYIQEPFFDKLNILISDKYKKHRKAVQEIRQIAFHLDSDDKSTKVTLGNLKLSCYEFISSDSDKMIDFYFNMADTIDFNYLIDKFKEDQTETEIFKELLQLVTELMELFGVAGHEFILGLSEKMNFIEYID